MQPSRSSCFTHWSTPLCSMAVVTMWRPTRRFWCRAARMAQLSPSVPQEVKKSSSGRHPRAPAITARSRSSRSLAARPAAYWAEGLAKCSVITSTMAWAAWGETGVVAA